MRGAVAGLLGLALLTAGCGAAQDNPPDDQAGTPPHLWPVEVSTGQRFTNEEFGISAVFPNGAAVCVVETGTHHHGYYGRLGYQGRLCSPSKDTPQFPVLAVNGDYNAAESRTARELLPDDCIPEEDAGGLALPGLASVACRQVADGRVTILVAGLSKAAAGEIPSFSYSAWLSTSVATLEADKAVFRRFLDGLVLTPPAPQGG